MLQLQRRARVAQHGQQHNSNAITAAALGAACTRSGPRQCQRLSRTVKTAMVDAAVTASPKLEEPHSPPAQPSEQPASDSELYNWFAAWYPVAAVEYLKVDRPNAVQLLGLNLVLWKDSIGQWSCLEDVCPHRLAPLSEGRIHPKLGLQCSYHGWTFDSSGSCTSIPQIGDPKAHATACASQRGCVKHYPVKELHGLLWVYPDHTADAWLKAIDDTPNTANPQLLDGSMTTKAVWFQRDVPLSLDTLIENFLDPSHVPFSHHGVVGDREAQQAMDMQLVQESTMDGGFAVMANAPLMWGRYKLEFTPPCLGTHYFPGVTMLLYGTPTRKGWCRVMVNMISDKDSKQSRPNTSQLTWLLNAVINVIDQVPALQHAFNRNAIIDGDSYFLHGAERLLYARGDHTSWSKQYYMPGTADLLVLQWRKWLDRWGAKLPTLPQSAADLGPAMGREVVFDRYNQHTKHCPHCSAALRTINIAVGVLAAVVAVAAACAVVAVTGVTPAVPLLSTYNAVCVGVAAVAGALAAVLLRLRAKFVWEDYVHAEH